MNHFFFLAWLEWTVLDYDDFIILRISFRIFASLFINEIDFIWFWPQTFMKHHHYLIFSNRKKSWQRCFSSEPSIEIVHFLFFLVLILSWFLFLLMLLFKKVYFIVADLNVVLISAVQQSDSVIHISIFFFIFFPVTVYHRILTMVPHPLQLDLVVFVLPLLSYICLLVKNICWNFQISWHTIMHGFL